MTTHHLVYVDESGEPGASYALGAVFLRHDQWLTIHDQIVGYRRHLAREHRFLTRHELKAYELLGNGGPWRDLQVPARTRHGIYRSALRVLRQAAPAARAIGVVAPDRDDVDLKGAPEEATWRTLLERVEAFCRHNDSTVMLLVDQGSWSHLTRLLVIPGRLRPATP